ncbi:nucleotidyl transferase AbiEii/AbiGii toxin family protein [Streptomyces lydicamycinicus]
MQLRHEHQERGFPQRHRPVREANIAHTLQQGLSEQRWHVTVISAALLSARLVATGAACEVDILKENLWSPPRDTEYGPVLSLDDVIRALADRGAVRDLIDVHAAAEHHTRPQLEQARPTPRHGAFRLDDLRDRLPGAEWYDDEEFAAYSLTEAAITELRSWAQQWASDLDERLARQSGEYDD